MDPQAAMKADIEAMRRLEVWRGVMGLEVESKEYKKMKKVVIVGSTKRLANDPGSSAPAEQSYHFRLLPCYHHACPCARIRVWWWH